MKKIFVKTIFIRFERITRYFLFISTTALILFLIIYNSSNIVLTPTAYSLSADALKVALDIYKAYRNLFYLIYLGYIPLVITAGIIHVSEKKAREFFIICLAAAGLLLYITFSYALAGLALDLILLLIQVNRAMLKSQGV